MPYPDRESELAVTVREMRAEEARMFLEVHRAAVRGIAAKDYPSEAISIGRRFL